MEGFIRELAERRRFGMKPGLDTMSALCGLLGDPQKSFRAIHVAGTNGKGAVCAIIESALRGSGRVGRYTSPHLIRLNERFFIDGAPVADSLLERFAAIVHKRAAELPAAAELTFFEALTAVAFLLFAEEKVSRAVIECGLGGRLDATNICVPELCVITRIGLDHCDWLGDTVKKIAAEKGGIIKPGVPVVLGRNEPPVIEAIRRIAAERGSRFFYAPDLATDAEVPADFSLLGSFNRENAVTALAALKVLGEARYPDFRSIVWPGRFQRVGRFIVDGAHNPPAAIALASALEGLGRGKLSLIAGFCGDKDVSEVLRILSPFVRRGFAVRTSNQRSLTAEETASKMAEVGIDAVPCDSLGDALASSDGDTLVCGSLFLVGEALVMLGAYPWPSDRRDPAEVLRGATAG